MLLALLLVAAGPAQPSPQDEALEANPAFRAYREWRICLDDRLGRPPRLRRFGQAELETAFAACRARQEALGTAARAHYGPAAGAGMAEGLMKSVRSEYGADALPR
jgi:hypothetical protein